jgi:hypothetical protein
MSHTTVGFGSDGAEACSLLVQRHDYSHYLLLPCEDVLVEVVLDLLVSNIDAQLFKRIPWKIFKPKNVQQAH